MKKLLLIGVVFTATLPMTAAARGRVGIFVGPGIIPHRSFGWYGWYNPYWGMNPYGPYFDIPNAGEVKLDTKVKDAQVFIDGNYAGTTGELKTMTMESGNYSIEIRSPGRTPFRESIHVVAGKTMKLHPDLEIQAPPTGFDS